MKREDWNKFQALTGKGKLTVEPDGPIEINVDGQDEEVTDLPAIREDCTEEACDCPGYHIEIDYKALESFPEILAEQERGEEAAAQHRMNDRAIRRAESGYADA